MHYLVVFHRIHSGGEKVPLCNLLVFGFFSHQSGIRAWFRILQ